MKKLTLLLFVAVFFFALYSNVLAAKTFYISSSVGSDTNDGLSEATPWKNLEKVYIERANISSGDSILLKRGDGWEGQIIVSGKSLALIGAYGTGAKPIIYSDGRGFVWTEVSGHPGVYSAYSGSGRQLGNVYDGNNTRYTKATGEPCCGAGALDTFLNNMAPGQWGPHAGGFDTVWVHTLDGNPPVNFRVFRNPTIYLYGANGTVVENLDIRETQIGYYGQNNNNVTLRNLDINHSTYISIYLSTNHTNATVENNVITNGGYTAIYIYKGTNNIIRNNNVNGIGQGFGGIPPGEEMCGIGLQESQGNLIEYNKIYNTVDSGVDFWLETGSTIRYNYFESNNGGFYPSGTDLVFYGNIVKGKGMSGANSGALPIKIFNNTFYVTTGWGMRAASGGTGDNMIFRNNIVYTTGANISLVNFSEGVDSDYNCYFSTQGPAKYVGPKFVFGLWPDDVNYWSFSDFQTASGKETHSVYGDPKFTADLQLGSDSACKDMGANLSSLISIPYKDYVGVTIPQGSAPDAGAYELVVTGTPPVIPPVSDTTSPTISITIPTSGATVSANATVTASASDNVGIAGVQFKLDGTNLGEEDLTSPYSITWNTTASNNGAHSLTAVARDAAGNSTTATALSVTVSNTVATTVPPAGGGGGGGGSSTVTTIITNPLTNVTTTTLTNTTTVPGCDNRTSGFSTTTGQACAGNVTTTTTTAIPGCDNRNTGFSITTGQSCIGNTVTASSASISTNATASATSSTIYPYNFGTSTLKNGSKGEAVKELQRFLNQALNLGLVVDGKLGPKTVAVVKKWQKDNGLVADGLVGNKTKAKMNAVVQ